MAVYSVARDAKRSETCENNAKAIHDLLAMPPFVQSAAQLVVEIGLLGDKYARIRMNLRSFNPRLKPNFSAVPIPSHQYGFKNLCKADACQQILDHVQLPQKYPSSQGNLDIIDVFSGYGLFSTMLNYELKPRNHIIIDNTKDNKRVWEERISFLEAETGNTENFKYFNLDGHSWDSYDKIINQAKVIAPSFQPRNKIHDELLIVGNMTSNKMGESLFAQWLQCCACENWLQRYGRVRMLLMIDSSGVPGDTFDPNVLVEDQPLVLPTTAIAPSGGDFSVVEVTPRPGLDTLDVNALDYLAQIMMYRSLNTVEEGLSAIAPGAADDLAPKLPHETLQKMARQLTREDMIKIHDVYNNWAFKPSYEETLSFFSEDTRTF